MRSALIWLRLNALMKKRIPTILGLGVLIIGVIGGVLLVGEGTGGFLPRASEEAVPQQVRITNISESSFTVSFVTLQDSQGLLEYGSDAKNLDDQILDDRDQLSGEGGQYRTHHVTVRSLQPATQYYFRIGTGKRAFFDNQGAPFTVRTARAGDQPTDADSAFGRITTDSGLPATGSLIYLTASGASPLSAYIKEDGSWSIPLNQIRTQDLSAFFEMNPTTEIKVQVVSTTGQVLNVTVLYSQLDQLATLQFGQDPVIAAANPDPTTNTTEVEEPESPSTPPSGNPLGGLIGEEDRFGTMSQSGITIVYPARDQEVVSATQPELSGQAPPQSTLQIEVHSDTAFYDVVEADASGRWTWSPPADLDPGEHTVTLRYTDENGNQQVETRTFIVSAGTNYPAFVSTPSGQLTSPTPEPTPIASPVPSPRPSPKPSPKPTPSLISYPATKAAQPVTGTSGPMWLLAAGSFFFVGMGAVWWVLKPATVEKTYGEPFT